METAIIKTAHELTLIFQDDVDIPERFKEKKGKNPSKQSRNTQVERRFQEHIKAWTDVINSIISHNSDINQAWRFIRITPNVPEISINSVTLCQDFLDFNQLLIKRRDIDNCGPDELGKLCMLLGTFQREIEKKITPIS